MELLSTDRKVWRRHAGRHHRTTHLRSDRGSGERVRRQPGDGPCAQRRQQAASDAGASGRSAPYCPQHSQPGDGLIIALLAVCPVRVGSFASLTLGRSFLRIGDGWWIRLAANETKSGRPDERPVPGFLTSPIDEYLRAYRPRFLCAGRVGRATRDGAALRGEGPEMATGPLWIAQRGEAMSLVTMK
jgi:hypothetical protein